MRRAFLLALPSLAAGCAAEIDPAAVPFAVPAPRVVTSEEELRDALHALGPGAQVQIAAGNYRGGWWLEGIHGTLAAPVRIGALDPATPPTFEGGGAEAWHLSDCSHVTLSELIVRGYTGNGINVDDGGSFETPARGIRIERVQIENIGPEGNHDALKMSGVDGFAVKDCRFLGWGGSAVDLVGCHDGVIEACTFEALAGFSQSSGVQIKGGSARVQVLECVFRGPVARAVNAGGSTGLAYFRPPDADAEARDVEIRGCRFYGGDAPVAAVGVVGLRVVGNLIHQPERWVLRILQESRDARFAPCSDGLFEDNEVIFDARVRTLVNVGPGTRPESFQFLDNVWIELGPSGTPMERPRQPAWPPQ